MKLLQLLYDTKAGLVLAFALKYDLILNEALLFYYNAVPFRYKEQVTKNRPTFYVSKLIAAVLAQGP